MVVFNQLVPAFTLLLTVRDTFNIGSGNLSTGGSLILGNIVNGTLISEPGFETQIKSTVSYTSDYPTVDPDGLHDRPNARGLLTTDDGEYLQFEATGIQTIVPELGPIITGTGSGNLAFGSFQSVFIVSFRTGAAKYKNLADSIFVGSETVRSLGGGVFQAGLKISKLYSTQTNVTLDQL